MLNIHQIAIRIHTKKIGWLALLVLGLASCSVQKQVGRQAHKAMLDQPGFEPAHVGITILDAGSGRYWYNHNGSKLFVPASNTKLFTCYAALKYLGDSIPAAIYTIDDDRLNIQATGDPTFLHPDFAKQALYDLMNQERFESIGIYSPFASKPLGRGWAWDDYTADYMAERDPFPVYGNLATFTFKQNNLVTVPPNLAVVGKPLLGQPWQVERNLGGHFYLVKTGVGNRDSVKTITLPMESGAFAATLLQDTLHKPVEPLDEPLTNGRTLFSQPTDSLLSIMMHRSDNFFAEQSLLMVSNKMLGVMSDSRIIDTLLNTDYNQLPQPPKWVDGSGLSRYNLFSPQDFVWLLQKMENDFGFERLQAILPTGNMGTLRGLYTNYGGRIYAKTGTLSNNVALSGYVITRKNRKLIFSVLVNNHVTTAAAIRRGIEAFLTSIADKY